MISVQCACLCLSKYLSRMHYVLELCITKQRVAVYSFIVCLCLTVHDLISLPCQSVGSCNVIRLKGGNAKHFKSYIRVILLLFTFLLETFCTYSIYYSHVIQTKYYRVGA